MVGFSITVNTQICSMMTMQQLFADGRQVHIGKDVPVESLFYYLFDLVVKYNISAMNYYGSDSKSCWMCHPGNIIVFIQKESEDYVVVNHQVPFALDFALLFLFQLGVENNPMTFQQMLACCSTPQAPLNKFSIIEQLKSSGLPVKEMKINQIESIVNWLLTC